MSLPPPRFTPPSVENGRLVIVDHARRRRLRRALARLIYHALVAALGWAAWDGIKELLS